MTLIQPDAAAGQIEFGRIADLEIGSDGSVFVLDGLSRTVRVFDSEGRELREFGRRGQGPGEFAQPTELLWGPKGNLWVLDLGNGRLTAFDPDGELISSYRPTDVPIIFPFAVSFSGADRLEWAGITSPDPATPTAGWVETALEDGSINTTSEMDLPFVEWPLLFEHRSDAIAFVLPVPFSGEPLFGFDPSGRLWYAHTGAPQLHRWSTSGGLQLILDRDQPPTAVTSVDAAEALAASEYEELRTRLGEAGVTELSAMIPNTKPYLAGFFFDDEDQVWVVRAGRGGLEGGEHTIDVYDLEGALVGVTQAALASDPTPRVRDGVLAAVVRSTLGVESVVLYRVDR